MQRPRVIIVGGMDFNIPDELKKRFEIVKHLEQKVNRVDRVPEADFIFVISDFVSHTMVNVVKHMAKVPVVYLTRGWAHMKTELERRSILPPETPEAAEEPARQAEEPQKDSHPKTGLSNDDLWEQYGEKVKQAIKAALKPKELVREEDLLEIVADLVGLHKDELRSICPKGGEDPILNYYTMHGLLGQPQEGIYCLLVGSDGFACGKDMPEEKLNSKRTTRRHRPAGEAEERAKKIAGLRMGPYLTASELCREMMKYEEFHQEGHPLSMETLRRLIRRAIELKIVDDTHAKLFVDHRDDVVLKRTETPVPEELLPVEEPPLSDEGKTEKADEELMAQVRATHTDQITKEIAERLWKDVVDEVRTTKPHIATILYNSRIEWMGERSILCCLVPQEYSIYMRQLDDTANWGLISSIARTRFGSSVVVRFLLDNSMTKGKV